MDDFMKSMKAWLYDRTSNPFFFIFILSWSLWNYKLYVIALSSGEPLGKISLLNQLYANGNERLLYMFCYPLTTTIGMVVVYPLLSNVTFIILKWWENKFAQLRLDMEHKRAVSEDEFRMLRADLIALQESYAELENKKNAEVSSLRKIIATQQYVKGGAAAYPGQELNDLDHSILLDLKTAFDRGQSLIKIDSYQKEKALTSAVSRTQIDVALRKLQENDLVMKRGNDVSGYSLELSDRGKKMALEVSSAAESS